MLKDLASQMPTIQRNYSKYHDYAIQSLENVFTKEQIEASTKFEAKYFASVYLENNNNHGFTIKLLPAEAQFAPIYGTSICDCDDDGNLDVMIVGNSMSTQIEMGHEDALNGLILRGDGKGNFTSIMANESGFYAPYDAKSLARLSGDGFEVMLVGNNLNNMNALRMRNNGRALKLAPNEYKIVVTLASGQKQVIENGYGMGYLSQNSRVVRISSSAKSAEIFNFKGKSRTVNF